MERCIEQVDYVKAHIVNESLCCDVPPEASSRNNFILFIYF